MSTREFEERLFRLDPFLATNANLNFTVDGGPWTTQLQLGFAATDGISVLYTLPPNNPFATNELYLFTAAQGAMSLPGSAAITNTVPLLEVPRADAYASGGPAA